MFSICGTRWARGESGQPVECEQQIPLFSGKAPAGVKGGVESDRSWGWGNKMPSRPLVDLGREFRLVEPSETGGSEISELSLEHGPEQRN